jgi:hypothetical protein
MRREYEGITKRLQTIATSLEGVTGDFINFKFSLVTGEGEIILDPATGNYKLVESVITTVGAKVKPRTITTIGAIESNPGLDVFSNFLEGYLVTPRFIPALTEAVDAEYLQNGQWIKGKFIPANLSSTPVLERTGIYNGLGMKISGYFNRLGDNPI